MLSVGSRGSDVVNLQNALNRAGAHLAADGVFGPKTKAAVVAYQRSHGLAADGIVGPNTGRSVFGSNDASKWDGFNGGSVSSGGGVSGSGGINVTSAMRRLAAAGRSAAMSIGGYTSHGLCATGVSRAISNAFGFFVGGNGNQIDNNLPRSKFKQINIPLSQALKIPGLVLTWEHTSTRLGSIYGHTAITTGDGSSSCSDFIERNTLAGSAGRSGLKIFMPTI